MTALTNAGGTVAAAGGDTITVTGLPAQRVVAVLGADQVAFSEVSGHRATLEEAYLELTRDSVEFRAATDATRSTKAVQ
jgi:ABC-2 type transport system ATP-binding protein